MDDSMMEAVKERVDTINWKEFACGWGAAFINITATFPIFKIVFRQMLDGIPVTLALRQLTDEGYYYLYRGMLPPLIQKTMSLSLMFGVYEEVRRPLMEKNVNIYLSKSIGGQVAGSCEAILMPFERIQTLLADSAYHNKFRNSYHAFKVVLTQYGIGEYYRGLVPILLRNGPSNALFFIIRDEVQDRLPTNKFWLQHNINQFITGALIGACLSSLFYPLNVIKVAMQCQLGGPYQNIFVVFKNIYKERGGKLRNIYYGVQSNCFRAFISWGVLNAAYDNMKKLLY